MISLKWNEIIKDTSQFHIAGISNNFNSFEKLHGHDFYELLFLETGLFEHNLNEKSIIINEGALIFITPKDIHQVLDNKGTSYKYYNLAFSNQTFANIQKRFSEITFDSIIQTPKSKRKLIINLFKEMANVPKNHFYIERFLMNLIHLTKKTENFQNNSTMPAWLIDLCEKAKQPKVFRKGTKEFIKIANRCHEHVARELKKYTQFTPSQYITKVRMEYAEQELIMSNKEIFEIAIDSGFDSLSYFYQKFKEYHKITPRQCRIQNYLN